MSVRLFFINSIFCAVISVFLSGYSFAASFQGIGSDLDGYVIAKDISTDGSIVVGGFNSEAFRWTKDEGVVSLGALTKEKVTFNCWAESISADGLVVTGTCTDNDKAYDAFRWTEDGGMESLFSLWVLSFDVNAANADGTVLVGAVEWEPIKWTQDDEWVDLAGLSSAPDSGTAADVSDDGSVVVGWDDGEAVMWKEENNQPTSLGFLPDDSTSGATAVSADGLVVVGESGQRAFLWTQYGGMVSLGMVSGTAGSSATDVSGDGKVVVGNNIDPEGVFVWDETSGIRDLQDILTGTYHLDQSGWKLISATAISADGKTIIGEGTNPDGNQNSWIATINDCDGSLEVGIEPTEAVSSGAQWRIDEGAWLNSDQIHSCLDVGSHTVEFQSLSGWTTPENQTINITENQHAVLSGTYTKDNSDDENGGCFLGIIFK